MRPLTIPVPVRNLLARLPQYPPAVLCAAVLNLLLGSVLSGRNLPAALGKVVAIDVTDAALRLRFRVREDGVCPCVDAAPDVVIRASADDFIRLALRIEDPDTLFFGRRLLMEGDTELGLLIKNTLDAVDLRAALRRPPSPGQVLRALAPLFDAPPAAVNESRPVEHPAAHRQPTSMAPQS